MASVRYPVELANWMMIASAGSFHRVHIDGAGLGTCIHMMKGVKLWFIATTLDGGTAIQTLDLSNAFNKLSPLELVKRFKWDVVLLQPGSRLSVLSCISVITTTNMLRRYMQPGTPHFVMTLEASVVHGSHFYCTTTLSKTMGSRLVDRTTDTSTNAELIANEVWIHALLASERDRLFLYQDPPHDQLDSSELASLVVMSMHPQWFVPKGYSGQNERAMVDTVVGLRDSRDQARKTAGMMLQMAKLRCEKVPVVDNKEYLESFLDAVNRTEQWLLEVWEAVQCALDGDDRS
jgi:hypothetical protein